MSADVSVLTEYPSCSTVTVPDQDPPSFLPRCAGNKAAASLRGFDSPEVFIYDAYFVTYVRGQFHFAYSSPHPDQENSAPEIKVPSLPSAHQFVISVIILSFFTQKSTKPELFTAKR
jgi:hypothetical protein